MAKSQPRIWGGAGLARPNLPRLRRVFSMMGARPRDRAGGALPLPWRQAGPAASHCRRHIVEAQMAGGGDIVKVEHQIGLAERWRANGHASGVLWLTGLSGAGKSTLAMALERRLFERGWQVAVLDGDNLRHGLSADLGFSPTDRAENIRRVGEVAALFARAGVLVVTAFISPYRADRARARAIAGDLFHEVWVKADLATCEGRDPKGLYARARAGRIPEFTGISAPYETPERPELVLETGGVMAEESLGQLGEYVEANFALP
ncbi:MAG: adenylyl-sulfate kinase, partial [Alphaproteobacteria bacterium]|nr:adenylyl-sulfate kinase [Alphaproteobacteria bacterium]